MTDYRSLYQSLSQSVSFDATDSCDEADDNDGYQICDCKSLNQSPTCFDRNCINVATQTECMRCPNSNCSNRNFTSARTVDLSVRATEGKGFGLFTSEKLRKGQFVVEFVGELISESELLRRMAGYDGHLLSMQLKEGTFIDATKMGSTSRFLNHSCEPNSRIEVWTVGKRYRVGVFTMTDVPAGAELTIDYEWEPSERPPTRCRCGTASCRGYIERALDAAHRVAMLVRRGVWTSPSDLPTEALMTDSAIPRLDPQWLLGRRVKVWWEGNLSFFEADVESYNAKTSRHALRYVSDGSLADELLVQCGSCNGDDNRVTLSVSGGSAAVVMQTDLETETVEGAASGSTTRVLENASHWLWLDETKQETAIRKKGVQDAESEYPPTPNSPGTNPPVQLSVLSPMSLRLVGRPYRPTKAKVVAPSSLVSIFRPSRVKRYERLTADAAAELLRLNPGADLSDVDIPMRAMQAIATKFAIDVHPAAPLAATEAAAIIGGGAPCPSASSIPPWFPKQLLLIGDSEEAVISAVDHLRICDEEHKKQWRQARSNVHSQLRSQQAAVFTHDWLLPPLPSLPSPQTGARSRTELSSGLFRRQVALLPPDPAILDPVRLTEAIHPRIYADLWSVCPVQAEEALATDTCRQAVVGVRTAAKRLQLSTSATLHAVTLLLRFVGFNPAQSDAVLAETVPCVAAFLLLALKARGEFKSKLLPRVIHAAYCEVYHRDECTLSDVAAELHRRRALHTETLVWHALRLDLYVCDCFSVLTAAIVNREIPATVQSSSSASRDKRGHSRRDRHKKRKHGPEEPDTNSGAGPVPLLATLPGEELAKTLVNTGLALCLLLIDRCPWLPLRVQVQVTGLGAAILVLSTCVGMLDGSYAVAPRLRGDEEDWLTALRLLRQAAEHTKVRRGAVLGAADSLAHFVASTIPDELITLLVEYGLVEATGPTVGSVTKTTREAVLASLPQCSFVAHLLCQHVGWVDGESAVDGNAGAGTNTLAALGIGNSYSSHMYKTRFSWLSNESVDDNVEGASTRSQREPWVTLPISRVRNSSWITPDAAVLMAQSSMLKLSENEAVTSHLTPVPAEGVASGRDHNREICIALGLRQWPCARQADREKGRGEGVSAGAAAELIICQQLHDLWPDALSQRPGDGSDQTHFRLPYCPYIMLPIGVVNSLTEGSFIPLPAASTYNKHPPATSSLHYAVDCQKRNDRASPVALNAPSPENLRGLDFLRLIESGGEVETGATTLSARIPSCKTGESKSGHNEDSSPLEGPSAFLLTSPLYLPLTSLLQATNLADASSLKPRKEPLRLSPAFLSALCFDLFAVAAHCATSGVHLRWLTAHQLFVSLEGRVVVAGLDGAVLAGCAANSAVSAEAARRRVKGRSHGNSNQTSTGRVPASCLAGCAPEVLLGAAATAASTAFVVGTACAMLTTGKPLIKSGNAEDKYLQYVFKVLGSPSANYYHDFDRLPLAAAICHNMLATEEAKQYDKSRVRKIFVAALPLHLRDGDSVVSGIQEIIDAVCGAVHLVPARRGPPEETAQLLAKTLSMSARREGITAVMHHMQTMAVSTSHIYPTIAHAQCGYDASSWIDHSMFAKAVQKSPLESSNKPLATLTNIPFPNHAPVPFKPPLPRPELPPLPPLALSTNTSIESTSPVHIHGIPPPFPPFDINHDPITVDSAQQRKAHAYRASPIHLFQPPLPPNPPPPASVPMDE